MIIIRKHFCCDPKGKLTQIAPHASIPSYSLLIVQSVLTQSINSPTALHVSIHIINSLPANNVKIFKPFFQTVVRLTVVTQTMLK